MLSDLIAERNVLAGIFTYGENGYLEVADILSENSFTDVSNQGLFKAFKYLIEKKEISELDEASVLSACNEISCGRIFDKKTEREHAKAIFNASIKLNNIRTWAAKARKLEIAKISHNQSIFEIYPKCFSFLNKSCIF